MKMLFTLLCLLVFARHTPLALSPADAFGAESHQSKLEQAKSAVVLRYLAAMKDGDKTAMASTLSPYFLKTTMGDMPWIPNSYSEGVSYHIISVSGDIVTADVLGSPDNDEYRFHHQLSFTVVKEGNSMVIVPGGTVIANGKAFVTPWKDDANLSERLK